MSNYWYNKMYRRCKEEGHSALDPKLRVCKWCNKRTRSKK